MQPRALPLFARLVPLVLLSASAVAQERVCEVRRIPLFGPPPPPAEGASLLVIAPTFDPNVTPAQRAVILQAIADWDDLVTYAGEIRNPYPIHFENGPLPPPQLALATTSFFLSSGFLNDSTIRIDDDTAFFVDPTPGTDEEFVGGSCTGGGCLGVHDLLSVMRHEIGHALGWQGADPAMPHPLVAALVVGAVFDPARLDIMLDPVDLSHASDAAFPGELMTPSIDVEERRAVSAYPAVSLIARAIDTGSILGFVDAGVGTSGDGSADDPWRTLAEAFTLSAPGAPLVVIPGTYAEAPVQLASPHDVVLAQGGSVVVR